MHVYMSAYVCLLTELLFIGMLMCLCTYVCLCLCFYVKYVHVFVCVSVCQ